MKFSRQLLPSIPFLMALGCIAACSDDGSSESGDGDMAGDGDTTGDGDMAGDGDSEAPSSCAILEDHVGSYTVSGVPTDEEQRGTNTADHSRGTIEIAPDYAIDFDTGISFAATDIAVCYDRTNQDFDRRIQISYGADDNGEVINIYLSDSLDVTEIQFRHNDDGVNIRAAIE